MKHTAWSAVGLLQAARRGGAPTDRRSHSVQIDALISYVRTVPVQAVVTALARRAGGGE